METRFGTGFSQAAKRSRAIQDSAVSRGLSKTGSWLALETLQRQACRSRSLALRPGNSNLDQHGGSWRHHTSRDVAQVRFVLVVLQVPHCSVLCDTTVREQFDTVHVAAVIRREKHGYPTHVVWCTQSAELHVGNGAGLLLVRHQGRQSRCIDVARTQNVDPDSSALEVHDPTAREGTHCRLCGVMNGVGIETFDRSYRSIKDHGRTLRKQRQRLLDHEEQTTQVRIECSIEVFFRDFSQLSKLVESRVNEQDVDAAGLLPYGFVDPIYIPQVGSVSANSGNVATDLRNGLVQFGLTAPGYEYLLAFGNKALGSAQADTRAASSNDGNFVREFLFHKFPL